MEQLSLFTGVQPQLHHVMAHPLGDDEWKEVILHSWADLCDIKIKGEIGWRFFRGAVVGCLFQSILSFNLEARYPELWRGEKNKLDKDLVYIPDPTYSVEVKTTGTGIIAGNKVNVISGLENQSNVKTKSGFHLVVSFQRDHLEYVRLGWLEPTDWFADKSPKSNRATLSSESLRTKTRVIYEG